ncbi:MAG TPA: MBL fold metallo-hydrolase [Pseudolabrys sp.]|jgi:L-ascorbate metabolism protein UlaG (beta-lactamase superfamily)|nr:MBL fold metallo-hydrolase [Pseudolabrys sp.]
MRSVLLAIFVAVVIGAMPAHGQGAAPSPQSVKRDMMESCPGLVAERPPFRSLVQRVALNDDQVRLTYIGHSTFLIETPQGVRIATDYNGYVKPPLIPDVVTMNHAHSTHYTDNPEPEIKLVLRGWAQEFGKPARIDQQVKDVRIRNVPTNIRSYYGSAETERHGNSIFIFEVAGLCIVHLGHLHHTLNAQQLSEVGRPDIVLVPVDGSYTLDLEGMIEVLRGLKARMVIPMHYFSEYTLDRFLSQVGREWEVERSSVPSVLLSKATLPQKPKLLVLPGH